MTATSLQQFNRHTMNDNLRSDRMLQFLLDAVTDHAIYLIDLDGRVASWNTGAERLKGYERNAIIGQPFARFFSLEDQEADLPGRILGQAAADGRVETEGWRIRSDGTRFWSRATVHAVLGEQGELIAFAKITRDMTSEREVQRELAESERRFRLLVDGVIDYAIFMLDVNGTITNWNKGAERIKGYRAEEVIGRHFGIFYPPEDRQAGAPARALSRALAEGRYESEGWRMRRDGGRFWAQAVIDPIYDDDGSHIGFAKITRDITERRAAEDALRASESQFRLLVSGVVDYALFMLDPNGIVSNWNPGAQRIKGYSAEEIVGQHFSRFYTDADRAAGVPFKALATAIEHGRYDAEGWRVRKDGSLFWASVVIDVIRDESGKVLGFAKITRDITDKRNAQFELQRAHEQLAQAQKMEALGQLTGGVAHDFNNLLMVVSGQAQLLRRCVGDDVRAQRALDAIEVSAQRGEDLTRHLLSFARRQRLRPSPVTLRTRLADLEELLAASLPASVQLVIDLPKDLWPVEMDQSEFELALLNLTVNARDAMPSGGALSITAENVSLARGGAVDGLEGEYVALTVADNGVGIPPDILPKIFDPFFTTKEVSKGTGLGLSQVYGFAQQSGGELTVKSELGQGARFTLYLPRSMREPVAEEAGAAEPEKGTSADILLVEDNPEVAEVAAGMLEQLGHRVRMVGSAAAAISEVRRAEPDLVFSDIVMAGDIDGVGLAHKLREEAPHIPILLATGYSKAAERIGEEFPILRKPYKLAELGRSISVLMGARASDEERLAAARQVPKIQRNRAS